MVAIKPLSGISFQQIWEAFREAFKDYEMQLDAIGLKTMLRRRGFVPDLSFGAFNGNDIVSFTLNGIGQYNKQNTAYDTGTGTIKAFRGQGLATDIFKHSIPYLKQSGVSQYLLEVLQHNNAAVSVYKKQGFKLVREFKYFVQDTANLTLPEESPATPLLLKPIELSWKDSMADCRDFQPSWQNSFDAMNRIPEDFVMRGVFDGSRMAAYFILEPQSGDIAQLAVHPAYRRKGIATQMMKALLLLNRAKSIKLINAEIPCTALESFLATFSIKASGKQYEMIKNLL